jgi:hypothetical protein
LRAEPGEVLSFDIVADLASRQQLETSERALPLHGCGEGGTAAAITPVDMLDDFLAPLMVQRYLDLYRTLSIPSTAT